MKKIKLKKCFGNILAEIFVDKYNCIVCDVELEEKSHYGLCDKCKSNVRFIQDRICKKCGRLQLNEADYCLTCQAHKRYFEFARSCVVYEDAAIEIVRGIKFAGKKYFAKYIVNFLVEKYKSHFSGIDIDVIVPVPMTRKCKANRGYNQSWEIAKRFADAVELQANNKIVAKVVETQAQAKLGGKEREENIAGAFEIKLPNLVKNKNVLIIDDVMTTGSTASEIAYMLKKAKAAKVYLLTFASTKFRIQEPSQDFE